MDEYNYNSSREYECVMNRKDNDKNGCGVRFKVAGPASYDKNNEDYKVSDPYCPNCGSDKNTKEITDGQI